MMSDEAGIHVVAGKTIVHGYPAMATSIALGRYPGVYMVDKFGENPAVGTTEEDIWQIGGKETLLTTAQTMYASCTDNVNGVGQVIKVDGLDADWDEQTGYATLTGQTQAPVVAADGSAQTWMRVHKAFQVSAEPDPVGDVYIAESDTLTGGVPDTTTKVHGYIDYTDAAQQTEKAMYTVPRDHHAMILEYHGSLLNATGTARWLRMSIEIQELADGATVAAPAWRPFRRVLEGGMTTEANSSYERILENPVVIGPLTNVHLRGTASASCNLAGGFTLLVFHNEYL
jgi:hypothetical protein